MLKQTQPRFCRLFHCLCGMLGLIAADGTVLFCNCYLGKGLHCRVAPGERWALHTQPGENMLCVCIQVAEPWESRLCICRPFNSLRKDWFALVQGGCAFRGAWCWLGCGVHLYGSVYQPLTQTSQDNCQNPLERPIDLIISLQLMPKLHSPHNPTPATF